MADVELTRVRKSFGAVTILHELSLTARSGEFLVLVGPSGCGKSTLLRLVAGLETPTAGQVTIGGRRVDGLNPKDRGVAMVFQNYALYPHMTVRENMGFALKLAGVPRAEIAARTDEAARVLSLETQLDKKPGQLSGGQKQRVAMGRAMTRRPQVFLFDEPLSNLDAQLRVQMRAEIARLHRTLKSTVIYVTHDQVEAMTLADRIAVLRGGRVEQIGAPLDVYHDPSTRFVAQFIGTPAMNFLPASAAPAGAA
ncbi:MAG: ATP-binding cassette domain-containing protein, partial [Elusimicrobia bacterium]|nr:ATP-binding cassette domain-containing protein [Elusimicrobiota bacterium]